MINILKIALPLPNDLVFDYVLPEHLATENIIGRRALVPLGKRVLTGYIVEFERISKVNKEVKTIIELLDDEPVFSNDMLHFAKWIAEYYMCSLGEVLKSALPQGMSPKSKLKIKLNENINEDVLDDMKRKAPKRYALLELMKKYDDFVSVTFLEKQLNTSSVMEQIRLLEKNGLIVCEKIIDDEIKQQFRKAIRLGLELRNNENELRTTLDLLDKKNPKQALVLSWLYFKELSNNEPIFISEAVKSLKISQNVIEGLVKKGYINTYKAEYDRRKMNNKDNLLQKNEKEIKLTNEQNNVLNQIINSIENDKFRTHLLYGVTGSGKTLIYIHAIRRILEKGKSALVLVPEISLTPQLIDRFEAFFPNMISVLHSRQSQGERYDSWTAIFNRKSKIVIGARSAIFAPLKDCGIIIVDEEHDPSYKQSSPNPRYNARDCAIIRGKIEKIPVILGSATPSIESMYNASINKYTLLRLNERADGAKLPTIKVIDKIEARKNAQMIGSISKELYDLIKERLNRKEGIILFQNRRGFANYIECMDCGSIERCDNCDVSLTYHKIKNQLKCHYCGLTKQAISICKICGGTNLKEMGTGTQRIEEELRELLSKENIQASIERYDLDATTKTQTHRKILYSFALGHIDILVGTQMVAKGIDFERVTLVGVINADLQLLIPDFRSSERTYQLLTQVSGRAGRSGDKPGYVIIQTSQPESNSILSVLRNSYDAFYKEEIEHRKKSLYPPFTRFVYIEFYGKSAESVAEQANYFRTQLPLNNRLYYILGPNNPSVAKIKKNYRKIILIKNLKKTDPNGSHLRKVLKKAYEEYKRKYKSQAVKTIIDIDSYSSI